MRSTIPAWTIAGISLAIAAGCIHALTEYVLDTRAISQIGKRTDFADGFGHDGYGTGA